MSKKQPFVVTLESFQHNQLLKELPPSEYNNKVIPKNIMRRISEFDKEHQKYFLKPTSRALKSLTKKSALISDNILSWKGFESSTKRGDTNKEKDGLSNRIDDIYFVVTSHPYTCVGWDPDLDNAKQKAGDLSSKDNKVYFIAKAVIKYVPVRAKAIKL